MLFSRLKTLSKESLIYGISGALSGFVSFLLLPLYTHALEPSAYGYLSVLTVLQTILEITVVFGLNSALFRYYLMADDEREKQMVLNSCASAQFFLILILTIAIFILSNQLSLLLFKSPNFSEVIGLVGLTAFASSIHTLVQSLVRAERKPMMYLLVQTFRLLLTIGFNVFFVVYLEKGYYGVIFGNLIATVVSIIPFLFWSSNKIKLTFSWTLLRKLIRFAWPIYLANLFFFILNLSDRFFLSHFQNPTDVGVYSLGSKLGSVIMIGVIAPFTIAVVPFVLSIAKTEDFATTFPKIIKYFFLIISFLSLSVFFFSDEILWLVADSSYSEAKGVVGPILIAYVFYGLYYTLSILLDIIERTYIGSYIVLLAATTAIISNILLIPRISLYGAVISNVLSNAILLFSVYYYCQKVFHLNYEKIAFLKVIALLPVFVCIILVVDKYNSNIFLSISLKLGLLLIFLTSLFLARVFTYQEKQQMKKMLRNIL